MEYGEAHTKISEFNLRAEYVRIHRSTISKREQKNVILRCSPETLGCDELNVIRGLGVLTADEVNCVFMNVIKVKEDLLQSTGLERDQLSERVVVVEKERDRMRNERDQAVTEKKRIATERNKAFSERRFSV